MKDSIFTNEEIDAAFKHTSFGVPNTVANHRLILKNALLKNTAGYHNGHTITQIMIQLGLISVKLRTLKKGLMYLREISRDYELMVDAEFKKSREIEAETEATNG